MKQNLIYFYLTLFLTFSSNTFASFENLGVGANYQAMGGAAVAYTNNADAIFINCGGLAQNSAYQLSMYYSNLFGMKELRHAVVSASLPIKSGVAGFGCRMFGNSLYQEKELVLSYSNNYQNKFYYGASLHNYQLSISNYGSNSSIGFDFGFIAVINSHLRWGFFNYNITRAKISSENGELPQIYSTGISLIPIDNLNVNFDIYKDVLFPVEYRFGFEYIALQRLALRSGFASEPDRFTAGFGLFFKIFSFNYALATHSDLGVTHQFSINFYTKSKKQYKTPKMKMKIKKILKITIVNINTASINELQQLKGVGPKLAKRIFEYRTLNGSFKNIVDLKNVKGIGDKFIEKNKKYIIVE